MRFLPVLLFLFAGAVGQPLPQPRHLEDVAFDRQRNRLILYGGGLVENGILTEFTQVHEWDGKDWIARDAKGPGGRNGAALVYHEAEKATFLIGGNTGKQKPYRIYYDVWRWNGQQWKQVNTTCPVKEPQAIYDPVHRRILVYGDASDKTKFMYGQDQVFELWEYRANTWQKLTPAGPHPDGPYDIAYDTSRQALIIPDWEEGKSVVWEWQAGEWHKYALPSDAPPPRNRYMMIYYPDEQATYLFGGFTADRQQLGDFWKWNGKAWTALHPAALPSKRNSAHFACADHRLLLYGGSVPKPEEPGHITLCRELWQWKDGAWKQLQ